MAELNEFVITLIAGEALEAYRRVKLHTTTNQVVYADQSDSDADIGITMEKVASGAPVAIRLKGPHEKIPGVASEAFAWGATLYAANDGKISDTASGNPIGTALEAATADGDVVSWLPDFGAASQPSPAGIPVHSASLGGTVCCFNKVLTATAEALTQSVVASFPRKGKILRAWFYARGTDAADVTLKQGASGSEAAVTEALAKGVTDNAFKQWATLIATTDEIAAGASLVVLFSAAGSIELTVEWTPIA
jgi:hypothetical protein